MTGIRAQNERVGSLRGEAVFEEDLCSKCCDCASDKSVHHPLGDGNRHLDQRQRKSCGNSKITRQGPSKNMSKGTGKSMSKRKDDGERYKRREEGGRQGERDGAIAVDRRLSLDSMNESCSDVCSECLRQEREERERATSQNITKSADVEGQLPRIVASQSFTTQHPVYDLPHANKQPTFYKTRSNYCGCC